MVTLKPTVSESPASGAASAGASPSEADAGSTDAAAPPVNVAVGSANVSGNLNTVVVLGDSISTGFQTSVQDSWPNVLVQDFARLGENLTLYNAAENGAGYLVPGSGGLTFSEQARAVVPEAQIVVVYGTENDIGEDVSQIPGEMAKVASYVRARAPQATLLFVGPASYTTEVDPDLLTIRDQIRDGAAALGDTFIDPIAQEWIMGAKAELIGPDGDHPTVLGHQYLAQKFEDILLPYLRKPEG